MLLHKGWALGFVLPACFGIVGGHLCASDVVERHVFSHQPRGVGLEARVPLDGLWRRERGDELGVALAQVPEVMQVTVAQYDKAAVLGLGVFARLLLAHQRVLALCLGLQHHQREAALIEQQKIDEPLAADFEVVAHGIDLCLGQADIGLQHHVGAPLRIVKKAPTRGFEQLVDLDAGLGFFGGHRAIVQAFESAQYPRPGFTTPATASPRCSAAILRAIWAMLSSRSVRADV